MDVPFRPALHTPEALASQMEGIYKTAPDTVLLGSLGRAVLFQAYTGNATIEFEHRNQTVTSRAGVARDIDVVDSVPTVPDLPFPVDVHSFHNPWVDVVRDGADWFLISKHRNFAELVSPDVMEPLQGQTVYGIPATTFPVRTQLALHGISGHLRPKDLETKRMLEELSQLDTSHPAVAELYSPFERLRHLNQRALLTKARTMYRKFVPQSIRNCLVPLVSKVTHL